MGDNFNIVVCVPSSQEPGRHIHYKFWQERHPDTGKMMPADWVETEVHHHASMGCASYKINMGYPEFNPILDRFLNDIDPYADMNIGEALVKLLPE